MVYGCKVRPSKNIQVQGGRSARDIFRGSGFIYKEYIMSPLTTHYNFQTFPFIFGPLFQDPYFYFERLPPGPINTLNPGRNHLK